MTISQEAELRPPTGVIADYLRRSISISYLAELVWSGRVIVIITSVLGLLWGIYTVHSQGPIYMATIKVSPAESNASVGDLGGAGGLLAGLTGGGGTVALPKFTQFLSAIGSEGVAQDLDKKYDMLCQVYKGECDPATHSWKIHIGLREWINGLLASLQGLPDPNGPRTDADLALYFGGSIVQEVNKNNSMVLLHYTARTPTIAVQRLSLVVKAANDLVRAQSHDTQKQYVAYLGEAASKTANVEQRQAIDTLLLQEERQLMLTEVDIPYAAKILDGPVVTPVNIAVKTLVVYTFLGLLAGIVIATSRNLLPRKWRVW